MERSFAGILHTMRLTMKDLDAILYQRMNRLSITLQYLQDLDRQQLSTPHRLFTVLYHCRHMVSLSPMSQRSLPPSRLRSWSCLDLIPDPGPGPGIIPTRVTAEYYSCREGDDHPQRLPIVHPSLEPWSQTFEDIPPTLEAQSQSFPGTQPSL